MDGKLLNMTSVYLTSQDKMLLLFRQGGTVVNEVWVGSAGGHFEEYELNDARACVLRELEEELNITEDQIRNLALRYITLRRTRGEIRQNYYFFASLKKEPEETPVSNEGVCRWFSYSELLSLQMPYSAKYVMEHYLREGYKTEDIYVGTADGETVVMLSHKKPDSVINVKVEFGEGEGKVPLDNIAKRAEAYKPKEQVTYKMIKEYIEAKYGFKVHTAYIAEVKRELGLPMYDAPNAVEELKQPRKHPTAEKAEVIKDALKYFEIL